MLKRNINSWSINNAIYNFIWYLTSLTTSYLSLIRFLLSYDYYDSGPI